MNRYAKIAVLVLVIGVAVMAFGGVWYITAATDQIEAMGREISSLATGDNQSYVVALGDERNDLSRMYWAMTTYNFGMIVVVIGVVVLALGMVASRPEQK